MAKKKQNQFSIHNPQTTKKVYVMDSTSGHEEVNYVIEVGSCDQGDFYRLIDQGSSANRGRVLLSVIDNYNGYNFTRSLPVNVDYSEAWYFLILLTYMEKENTHKTNLKFLTEIQ